MDKLSIIIPARNEQFLSNTINDIFSKSQGPIEIIVVLDGYWPNPPLIEKNNLVILHKGTPEGMRPAINSAANIATGKYLMKVDAHCVFDEGFDVKLQKDCKEDWLVVPTRYSVDHEKWERTKVNNPIQYHYLSFPYEVSIHGREFNQDLLEMTITF